MERSEEAACSGRGAGDAACESRHERSQKANRDAVGVEIEIKRLAEGEDVAVDMRFLAFETVDSGIEMYCAVFGVPRGGYVCVAEITLVVADRIDVKTGAFEYRLFAEQIGGGYATSGIAVNQDVVYLQVLEYMDKPYVVERYVDDVVRIDTCLAVYLDSLFACVECEIVDLYRVFADAYLRALYFPRVIAEVECARKEIYGGVDGEQSARLAYYTVERGGNIDSSVDWYSPVESPFEPSVDSIVFSRYGGGKIHVAFLCRHLCGGIYQRAV